MEPGKALITASKLIIQQLIHYNRKTTQSKHTSEHINRMETNIK